MQYAIPMPNGVYEVRLHFMEPNTGIAVNGRRFDIKLEGATVRSNYDIRLEAGAANKVVTTTFNAVSVINGVLDLEFLNLTSNGAVISAIEVSAIDPTASPTPTVTLQYSQNSGATWTHVAGNIPLDYYGRGNYLWTATDTDECPKQFVPRDLGARSTCTRYFE